MQAGHWKIDVRPVERIHLEDMEEVGPAREKGVPSQEGRSRYGRHGLVDESDG